MARPNPFVSYGAFFAIQIVAAVVLLATASVTSTQTTELAVLGLPVVSHNPDVVGWLAMGRGVVVVGAGVGVVAYTIYGAGLLFATGQLAVGLIATGQVGAGPTLFLGQAGAGLLAAGQVVGGVLTVGQGTVGWDGAELFAELHEDLTDLFFFR